MQIDWGNRNFINPPYSDLKATGYLKRNFVYKAIEEMQKGKLCVMILPVSTSTKLFHNYILPNITEPAKFVYKRTPFIGVNSKGQYVNWHLWDKEAPVNVEHVKNAGQHDSMVVVFDVR